MKVLVVGSGGREHTLVWKLAQSKKVDKVFCAPGNSGTEFSAENININIHETGKLINFARENEIDLTVVGPEIPLMNGIVDRFIQEGLKIFGPQKAAALLEGSKVFSKVFMTKHNIPTAPYIICNNREETNKATESKPFPYVIKVDGLAAGKGALIIKNKADLQSAINEIWIEKKFGTAGEKILVEDFLNGEEVSVFALTDGSDYVLLHPAQDHKRVFDNDEGLNTGGMGAYCPAPIGNEIVIKKSEELVIKPLLKGMKDSGNPFVGVLYCGLMIDNNEPSVVEFNVRFGDPEAQVIIPTIKSDLFDLLYSASTGKIDKENFQLSDDFATCVVAASGGYPESYEKGFIINGVGENLENGNSMVFLAGVKNYNNDFITNGGRVLGVTTWAKNLNESIELAYLRMNKINFKNIHYRKDIGKKGI